MIQTRRVATVAVATTIAIGSVGVPAMATTSSHWSKSQCQSWANGFKKRNPHPSSKRAAQANKVLKGKGCTQRV
jgi:hypothetical protein